MLSYLFTPDVTKRTANVFLCVSTQNAASLTEILHWFFPVNPHSLFYIFISSVSTCYATHG